MTVTRVKTAKSLRDFLAQLREDGPIDLVEVKRQIRPDQFEVTAILEHLDRSRRYPTVVFTNPTNLLGERSRFPIVSNVFATREHCALALGLDPRRPGMELSLGYSALERRQIEPIVVSRDEAPVKEQLLVGDQADIRILPIVRHYEMDLGPVLTMAQVMPGLDGSFEDVSFVKAFYKNDPRRMVVSIHTPHLERILAEYERRGEPAPIVNILGHHPAFYLGALALAPYANSDYAGIGSFLAEPLRLVPSETWGERVMVPADAEIIIEGEIPPGERGIADPFGEVTRLYQAQCLRPICNVRAITFRQDAIMQDVFSGHQGHWNLGALPKEGSVYNALQRKFGNIKAVHLPYSGCARLACYVSVRKSRPGQPKEIGLFALTESWTFQTVVVVDDDIDVFNEADVLWAIHTYVNPDRDVDLIKNVGESIFTTALRRGKVIIDATRPSEVAFPDRFKVPDEVMERVRLEDWIEGEPPASGHPAPYGVPLVGESRHERGGM
jgi:2,5-furandicarboxylate decarboxylase 1